MTDTDYQFGDIIGEGGDAYSDLAAEQRLIGRLLAKPGEIAEAVTLVGPADFYDRGHQMIFSCFVSAADDGFPVDKEAIVARLGGDENLGMLDGRPLGQYIGHLTGIGFDEQSPADELAEHIQRVAENRAVKNEPVAWRPTFHSRMGLKMWVDQNDPAEQQYEYIVEDLIPERQGVILMGETQTGKSFLTFHLAMCIARGVPFFGRRILKPMGVVWLAYEAATGATARMRAYRRHHGLELEDLPFAALTLPVHLYPEVPPSAGPVDPRAGKPPTSTEMLIEEIREIVATRFNGIPLGAVIIDTQNAATPGASEIDSEVVSKIRGQFHQLISELQATLIVVGHTNDSGKLRGNQQLTNNFDTVIKVSRKTFLQQREVVQIKDRDHREIRTMKIQKQREGIDSAAHDFVLRIVEDGTKNKFGNPRTSCVIDLPNAAAGDDVPREKLPPGFVALQARHRILFGALDVAIKLKGSAMPKEVRAPRGAVGVRWADWHGEAMRKLQEEAGEVPVDGEAVPKGKGTPYAKAKDAIRAAREKWDGWIIGHDEGWYWRTKIQVHGVDAKPKPKLEDLPDYDFPPEDFPPN